MPNDFDLRSEVHHIDQYFGLWMMLEDRFRAALDHVRMLDLRVHVQEQKQKGETLAAIGGTTYPVTPNGVAVIEMSGPLMKYASSLSGGTSTLLVRRQLRLAATDPEVSGILLRIDSPGGTVAGTDDLAAEIRSARSSKPVFAYIEDLGASAAYWAASQADKIFSNATAMVGCIGTYMVVHDSSRMYDAAGVDVHVIRAGDFKGAGLAGTKITEEQLAAWQDDVNTLNDHFLKGVSEGRRLSMKRVRELADGRVHIGEAAVALGLSDGVKSFDEVVSMLAKKGARSTARAEVVAEVPSESIEASSEGAEPLEKEDMSEQAKAATYAELKAELIGADAEFICAQLEKNATLADASKAWMAEQNNRIEQAKAEAKKPGVDALGSKTSATETDVDPVAAWNEAVEKEMKSGKSKMQALSAADRKNPGLRMKMLAAVNFEAGRHRAAAELAA